MLHLKVAAEMFIYTEQPSGTLDMATPTRFCASLGRIYLDMQSPYFIWPFYCVTSRSYSTARVIGRMNALR
jgi:hypothetical protein